MRQEEEFVHHTGATECNAAISSCESASEGTYSIHISNLNMQIDEEVDDIVQRIIDAPSDEDVLAQFRWACLAKKALRTLQM